MDINKLSSKIIGAAIEVHQALGLVVKYIFFHKKHKIRLQENKIY